MSRVIRSLCAMCSSPVVIIRGCSVLAFVGSVSHVWAPVEKGGARHGESFICILMAARRSIILSTVSPRDRATIQLERSCHGLRLIGFHCNVFLVMTRCAVIAVLLESDASLYFRTWALNGG